MSVSGFEEREIASGDPEPVPKPRSPWHARTSIDMDEDHRTEAACLLEQGALYRRRIGLEPVARAGEPIFAGFKHGAFSLYFGDAPIYHFDLEGRWQRAFVDGLHYLKGLDAVVQVIDRVREGRNLVLKRRELGTAEATDFDARVRITAWELMHGLGRGVLRR